MVQTVSNNVIVYLRDIFSCVFRKEQHRAKFRFYKVDSFLNHKISCSTCNVKVDLVNVYAVPLNLQSGNNVVVLSRGNNLLDKIVSCKSCFVCFTKMKNLERLVDSKRRRCEI